MTAFRSKLPAPDHSHRMTKWEGAIVTLIDTSRFGMFRKCKRCGAEQAETVSGRAMHPELLKRCSGLSK